MQLSLSTLITCAAGIICIAIFHSQARVVTSICSRDAGLSRVRRLEAVKQEILLRLGLNEEPLNPSNTTEDPEFLEKYNGVKHSQDLIDVRKPCAKLDFRTKEVLVYNPVELEKYKPVPKTASGDDCASNSSVDFYNTYWVRFHIDLREKDFIGDAQLRLRRSLLDSSGRLSQDRGDRVDITFFYYPENYHDGEGVPEFITSEFIDPSSTSGLTVFNVTKAITSWLGVTDNAISHQGEIEFRISIRCPQPLAEGIGFIPNSQFFENSHNDGQLVITTYEGRNTGEGGNRKKRSSGRSEVEQDQGELVFCAEDRFECCLERLTINFKCDFNWTWVIRPQEIAFNYCRGECAVRFGAVNEHSQLLEIYRSRVLKNPTAAPEPCCVPNSYASVPLGINLGGVHSIKLLDDIVATSCVCR